LEELDELLLLRVTADRARAGDLHGLDLLANDFLVEVAAQHLDLRQLRHRSPPDRPPLRAAAARRPTPRLARLASSNDPLPLHRDDRSRTRSRRNASRDQALRRARRTLVVRANEPQ